MKIVFLLHSYHKFNQGGAELQIKYIANYLIANKFEVHYVFLHNETINYNDEGIELHSIKKTPLLDKIFGKISYYKKVMEKLNKIQPDIIYHRNLSTFALAAVSFCKKNNCKSFLHLAHEKDTQIDKINLNKKILSNTIHKYGKKYIIKNINKIIGQAKYQDTLLQKKFDRNCDLIIENMHPYPEEEIDKTDKITILWIANFKEWKQPEKFINLAKEFENKNVSFKMIGRSSKDERTIKLINEIDSINNLSYLGERPIKEVNQLLAKSHIFINTSLSEGFPNTFIQAWMREVPVISLNVNPDDILNKEKIGFCSGEDNQLKEDLKKLIKNKELRESMGEKAKFFSYNTYSIKNIEKIINLIKE